jgi:hypothetical protein
MNIKYFKILPSLLPKKKKRGLRKYYKQLIPKAENFSIIEEPDHWFDFWHYHVDERNTSNKSWKNRKQHLIALVIIFHQIAKETKILEIPFQLWLTVYEKNGYDDAIFLHTPNPNYDDFPFIQEGFEWGNKEIESSFSSYFSPHDIRVGIQYDNESKQNIYILYSPSVGNGIE